MDSCASSPAPLGQEPVSTLPMLAGALRLLRAFGASLHAASSVYVRQAYASPWLDDDRR